MDCNTIGDKFIKNIQQKGILKGVSLISTVYNESDNILSFFESIETQTVYPEEIIIVDGGSTDETVKIINNFIFSHQGKINIRLIIDPTCNIHMTASPVAKGRNRAILDAKGEIIACTDAGCTLKHDWLEKITTPFFINSTVDVVGGWYIPDARSFFERCMAIVFLLPPELVKEKSFIPSARSLAFKKRVWEKAGGFPEISLTAEDTAFLIKLRKMGFQFKYVQDALVYWRMRANLKQFIKLLYRYGYGDGFTSIMLINVAKNIFKIFILLILILLLIYVDKKFALLLIVYLWVLPFNKRLIEAIKPNIIFKIPILVSLKLIADLAYLNGYIVGQIKSWSKSERKKI